jgi:hypothetical protein
MKLSLVTVQRQKKSGQLLMNDTIKQKIENFIIDWHWDKKSHKFAYKLCEFLFGFIDDLEKQGLSEKTIKKHLDNCWHIGILECGYGYRKKFIPEEIFYSPHANYEYEFKRKMSDSKYALQSYKATWKKVYKYTNNLKIK